MTNRRANERNAIRALAASVVMIVSALIVVINNHPHGPIFIIATVAGGFSILSISMSILIVERNYRRDRWHGPL